EDVLKEIQAENYVKKSVPDKVAEHAWKEIEDKARTFLLKEEVEAVVAKARDIFYIELRKETTVKAATVKAAIEAAVKVTRAKSPIQPPLPSAAPATPPPSNPYRDAIRSRPHGFQRR
ncbi:MAG: hypothetical protein LBJ75_02045, partial [Puniceicoccales bacterium]|nr:hypothetical protein [Puniceicoccales bacterium]